MNDTIQNIKATLPVPPGLTREQLISRGDTTDMAAADTVPPVWGVVIEAPEPYPEVKEPDTSMSWLFSGLLLCFVVVAFRFRNNGKYVLTLWKDLTEVRERRNVFDDTVRETSFLVLLNILWVATATILFGCLLMMTGDSMTGRLPLLREFSGPVAMTLTMITLKGALPVVTLYTLGMFFAYWLVGNVFSDETLTRMWVRGYAAANGILSVFLFPLSLLALCYPLEVRNLLIIGGILFVLAKFTFFYKGFRIFFSQGSSWVLFLYYLCSLEIVPLILAYTGGQISVRIW